MAYAIRFSALGVDSGGAVSAMAVSGCTSCTAAMTAGGATLGVDSGGATSEVDLSDAVSAMADSGLHKLHSSYDSRRSYIGSRYGWRYFGSRFK